MNNNVGARSFDPSVNNPASFNPGMMDPGVSSKFACLSGSSDTEVFAVSIPESLPFEVVLDSGFRLVGVMLCCKAVKKPWWWSVSKSRCSVASCLEHIPI